MRSVGACFFCLPRNLGEPALQVVPCFLIVIRQLKFYYWDLTLVGFYLEFIVVVVVSSVVVVCCRSSVIILTVFFRTHLKVNKAQCLEID